MSKDAAGYRSAIVLSVVLLLLAFLGNGCGSTNAPPTPPVPPAPPTPLFPQTQLLGKCLPKFEVSLPVFGPAGSVSRVDATAHPNLTVTMTEIDQPVLPQGFYVICGTS